MKRRVSVAIATLGNPKLLFFDEPSTGKKKQKCLNNLHFFK